MRLYVVETDDGEINKFFDIITILLPIDMVSWKKKKLALRGKGKSRKESSLKLQSSDSSAGVKTF